MENKYITVAYKLYVMEEGKPELVEEATAEHPFQFISGLGTALERFENEITPLNEGDKFEFVIPCAEAYGEYSDQLKISVPKTQFDTDVEIEVGMQFQAGMGQIVTVKEVKEKEVVIDANHPLAGETLYFDVEIVSVRAATSEEIAAILAPRGGCGGGCGGCGGGCGDDCNCDDDCSCGGCGN